VQSGQPNSPSSYVAAPSAVKDCRKCAQSKPLESFPRDRSRPDGRWHTCKQCNGQRCRFLRWAARKPKQQELISSPPPPAPRRRLEGLKSYRNTTGDLPFSHLPPRERFIAQQLFNKYLHKHRGPRLTQPKQALLMACAASNARRAGDRSWSRQMKRFKGWRRQRRRNFEQQIQLAEMRARSRVIPRECYEGAGWTSASRLAGI
jgi:hypothetical protein